MLALSVEGLAQSCEGFTLSVEGKPAEVSVSIVLVTENS
jgi:hypothetical protein